MQLFFGLCRSGYQGGTTCAIHRAIAFAPYADLLWMETKSPIYKQAKKFADGVHAAVPGQWLAYNLSPSFNWDAAGLGESEMKDYVWELGKLGFGTFLPLPFSSAVLFLAFLPRAETDGQVGFPPITPVWQFITLGGLHSNAYISDLFAAAFAKEGMKAYVELVQRRERDIGCDVLTHQTVRPSLPPSHCPRLSLPAS